MKNKMLWIGVLTSNSGRDALRRACSGRVDKHRGSHRWRPIAGALCLTCYPGMSGPDQLSPCQWDMNVINAWCRPGTRPLVKASRSA